jgi:hypothetical protein
VAIRSASYSCRSWVAPTASLVCRPKGRAFDAG